MNEKTSETIRNNARDDCGQLFVKVLRQIKTQMEAQMTKLLYFKGQGTAVGL